MRDEDIKYINELEERVNELETTVDFYQSALRDADRRVQELEKEIGDLDENIAAFETLWLEEKKKKSTIQTGFGVLWK